MPDNKSFKVELKETLKNTFLKTIPIAIPTITILLAFIVFGSYMNLLIDKQINNPQYLNHLSRFLRPYLIINKTNELTYDHGALEYIDTYNLKRHKQGYNFVLTLNYKKYLDHPPLIEIIGPFHILETKIKHINNLSWQYKLQVDINIRDPEPDFSFKVEILN